MFVELLNPPADIESPPVEVLIQFKFRYQFFGMETHSIYNSMQCPLVDTAILSIYYRVSKFLLLVWLFF